MHSAAIAEWILSLVAEPDRAASTVGDLVEESSTRGTLWFWSSVLQTAGSHFWHDLSASPLRMVNVVFWGLLTYWFLGACFGFLIIPVWISAPAAPLPSWGSLVVLVMVFSVVPFRIGCRAARRSDGREMAAAFLLVVLFAACYALSLYLSDMQLRRIGRPYPGLDHSLIGFCVQALSVTAGAIRFRRRTLAKRESAC